MPVQYFSHAEHRSYEEIINVRDRSNYVSKVLFVFTGIGFDSNREILGAKIVDAETELLTGRLFHRTEGKGPSFTM